jgi:putative hydrolase of HD superfamily
MDKIQPFLLNYFSGGKIWAEKNITSKKILSRNEDIKELSNDLWNFIQSAVGDSIAKGFLRE